MSPDIKRRGMMIDQQPVDGADTMLIDDYFCAEPRHVNYLINWAEKCKIIYVETPKVGCTAIKKILQYSELDYDMGNMLDDVHDKGRSPLKSPQQDQEGFINCLNSPEYFKFSFVRNPLTRVLSAYLDKIARHPDMTADRKQKLGLHVNEGIPTFGEFIEMIYGHEFRDMNPHWAPQSFLLGIENVRYDYLGRFEHFEASIEQLLAKVQLRVPEGTFASGRVHATNADELVIKHYSPTILKQVREIYHDDFKYLGYGWSL